METIPLVSIFCPTYNHEKYIRECLEGFVMQQTSFQIEVIVQDDASTDGTSKIVKEFAEKYSFIIPIIHKANIYSQGKNLNEYFYKNARGKYYALCEGDDYWTDPYKLQKQVNFLEGNPSYGMVYTKAWYIKKNSRNSRGGPSTTFENLVIGNTVPTSTTVYRHDLMKKYLEEIQPESRNWQMGDYPMWLYFSLNSKIHFLNEETSTYRVLDESASHSIDIEKQEAFVKSTYDIRQFFLEHAHIKYNKARFRDSLLSSLATSALMMKKRNRAKEYMDRTKELTAKNLIKKIVCSSGCFSYIFTLIKDR